MREGTPQNSAKKTVSNKTLGPSSLNIQTKIKTQTFRSRSKTNKTGSDPLHHGTLRQLRSKSKYKPDLPAVCLVHGGVFGIGACGWRAAGLHPCLSISYGLTRRCRRALVILALPFRRAFIPGHVNKQSQNHMHGEHGNDGCVEVAVRARHLHGSWGETVENNVR